MVKLRIRNDGALTRVCILRTILHARVCARAIYVASALVLLSHFVGVAMIIPVMVIVVESVTVYV